jgi:hypothetical protein
MMIEAVLVGDLNAVTTLLSVCACETPDLQDDEVEVSDLSNILVGERAFNASSQRWT